MKHQKKIIACLLILCLTAGLFAGCGTANKDGRLTIVVSVFPLYDWVKHILGDRAEEVNLVLLQDSGADLHNYQPTVKDIYTISTCDLFLCVGGESDRWAEDALRQAQNKDMVVLRLLKAMGEAARAEEQPESAEPEHEEDEAYDEHIWLSVKNAALLCPVITEALASADPDHGALYRENGDAYLKQLQALDQAYAETVEAAPRRMLLFADRFPFLYLVKDYGLSYDAAFTGCSAETEASPDMIRRLAEQVDRQGLAYIMVLEGSDQKLANTVIANAHGNPTILRMDSMQSVTAGDIKNGADYLSIMERNREVLAQALSG